MVRPVHPVLLFDGVCNLCNGAVQFVIKHDPKGNIHFASLQSEAGQQLLASHHYHDTGMHSVVFIEGTQLFTKSDAVLHVGLQLGGVWGILSRTGLLLPRRVRDVLYDWIANNRYRWLGKAEQCLLPTREIRSRFLE